VEHAGGLIVRSALRPWWLAARPKTLPAAAVPVLVGTALAVQAGAWEPVAAALCLTFALLVQIGTNFANDYFDFVQGADTAERVGPARAVAAGWVAPAAMRRATVATFAVSFAVGLGLVPYGGWWLVPLGLLCIASGVAYTASPFRLGYRGLGDVFVFLFFGLVAVGATFYVQAGEVSLESVMVGAAIGALAANLLVANNYRDRATDARAGKRTTVVRFGERFGRMQYAAGFALSWAVPVWLWVRGGSPWVLLPLALVPLGVGAIQRLRPEATPGELIALLGRSAAYLAVYGVLLAVGLVAGG
jgi:1,4-dihydroxy-2-naphthoate octaprenyltransferase